MGLIVIALSFVAMYLLFIKPQQRKMREHQELIASVEEGDEIQTTGGLYGTIVAVDGQVVILEIAEGLEVRLNRSAIADLVTFDPDADDAVDEQPARPTITQMLGLGRGRGKPDESPEND